MDLLDAVNTFARGFAASRSITHPYEVDRPAKPVRLFICRDAPHPTPPRERRNREYLAVDLPPDVVVAAAGGQGRHRHVVCAIHAAADRDRALERAYAARGYRYLKQEPLFVRALPPAPRGSGPLPIRRVRTARAADAVATAARSRQIPLEQVGDDTAPSRLFAAFDGDAPVGWVCSVRVGNDSTWVANLFVRASLRGRGIGTALMKAMLRDDHRRGIRHSVLTASQAGARVYRKLGYEQVATVELFTPQRRG